MREAWVSLLPGVPDLERPLVCDACMRLQLAWAGGAARAHGVCPLLCPAAAAAAASLQESQAAREGLQAERAAQLSAQQSLEGAQAEAQQQVSWGALGGGCSAVLHMHMAGSTAAPKQCTTLAHGGYSTAESLLPPCTHFNMPRCACPLQLADMKHRLEQATTDADKARRCATQQSAAALAAAAPPPGAPRAGACMPCGIACNALLRAVPWAQGPWPRAVPPPPRALPPCRRDYQSVVQLHSEDIKRSQATAQALEEARQQLREAQVGRGGPGSCAAGGLAGCAGGLVSVCVGTRGGASLLALTPALPACLHGAL